MKINMKIGMKILNSFNEENKDNNELQIVEKYSDLNN